MQNVITPIKTEERTKLGIRPGDTVRVHQKIIEKGKTRIQIFEGLVLAVKHGTEAGATFTVRATLSGVGVEKIFPLYASFIEKIEITRRSKVRRAKLYFIREKVAREVRRQLRNMRMVTISSDDFAAEEEVVTTTEVEESPAGSVAEGVEPVVAVEEELETKDPAQPGELVAEAEESAAEPISVDANPDVEAPLVEEPPKEG
ncbi:50S ribosomal protein L19 [Patescibacteria group bacterium]|nr:50S ribosomal protein L19 [Patescibacteria group bacterium]